MQDTKTRQDTRAWKFQVWISFGMALTLCGIGLGCLPRADIDKLSMLMGYGFCLSTAFALAKFIRDNEDVSTETPVWGLVVSAGFGVTVALTGWGLVNMTINPTYKAFLGFSWLFLISTAFTLANTSWRDAHEATLARSDR